MTAPSTPAMRLPKHLQRFHGRGLWTGSTVGEAARAIAERSPDQPLYLAAGLTCTAAQIVADAEALAVAMRDLGVGPGTTVSFQLPNWTEAAVVNVACSLLGAIVMPIVPIYRDAEVGQMLRDGGSRLHFSAAEFRGFDHAAMLARLRADLPDLRVVLVRGPDDGNGYTAMLQSGRGRNAPFPRTDPASVKLLLYTSGTTGRAKGVLHSQDTLSRCIREVAGFWALGAGDHVLMPSPVTHITGYALGLELPLVAGTRTVLMETWDAAEAARLIDRHQVVATLSATPFLAELTGAVERTGARLPSLRIFACGGAPVPPELVRRANGAFANRCAFRVYGASEVPMVTWGFRGAVDPERVATTDGEVIDYDVIVVDDQGKALARGLPGEILARGPSMFLGYTDDDATRAALTPEGCAA